jgi:hypothetical protein
MPTHVGGDQKGPPALAGKESAECGQQGPIDWPIANTTVDLSFEDMDLMAQDEDLQVLVDFTLLHTDDQLKKPAQAQVEKREDHDPRSWHPDLDRGQPAARRTGWSWARSENRHPMTRAHVAKAR